MKKVVFGVVFLLAILGIQLFITSTISHTGQALANFLAENNPQAEVAEAYRFALENPQGILSKVKCYCGCLKNQRHKNNRDCFIQEDDGFDKMGLNCGLCVKTALISKQMLAEGKSGQEISDYVDTRWGKSD